MDNNISLFCKDLLDGLDSIESRTDPLVEKIVQGIKEYIRQMRDIEIFKNY